MRKFSQLVLLHGVMIVVPFAIGFPASNAAQDVPPGVRYRKTSDAINEKARLLLETALKAKPGELDIGELFGGPGVCDRCFGMPSRTQRIKN